MNRSYELKVSHWKKPMLLYICFAVVSLLCRKAIFFLHMHISQTTNNEQWDMTIKNWTYYDVKMEAREEGKKEWTGAVMLAKLRDGKLINFEQLNLNQRSISCTRNNRNSARPYQLLLRRNKERSPMTFPWMLTTLKWLSISSFRFFCPSLHLSPFAIPRKTRFKFHHY